MTALTGPDGCPQTFARVLSSLPPKPAAAPPDTIGAEWISRVLAPPFFKLLKYPEVAGAVAFVAERSTPTSIEAVCRGLAKHVRAAADDAARGAPYADRGEAVATRLCMFARSLRVASTSPVMLDALAKADEPEDGGAAGGGGFIAALGTAFEATGARDEAAGLRQLVVGFEANVREYERALLASRAAGQ